MTPHLLLSLWCGLLLLGAGAAHAEKRALPKNTGAYIQDSLGYIDSEALPGLEDDLERLEQKVKATLLVVVLPSVDPYLGDAPQGSFAERLFFAWRLTFPNPKRTALLIIGVKDRRAQLALGSQLQKNSEEIRSSLIPPLNRALREETSMGEALEYALPGAKKAMRPPKVAWTTKIKNNLPHILLGLFFLAFFVSLVTRRKKGWAWEMTVAFLKFLRKHYPKRRGPHSLAEVPFYVAKEIKKADDELKRRL